MAWEWFAPAATAVVGLGGIAATALTARGSRAAQERSMLAQQAEARRLIEYEQRRDTYAKFVAEARSLSNRIILQKSLDGLAKEKDAEIVNALEQAKEALPEGLDPDTIEKASNDLLKRARKGTVHHRKVLTHQQVLDEMTTLPRLAAETRLLAGPAVREAVTDAVRALAPAMLFLLTDKGPSTKAVKAFSRAVWKAEKCMREELTLREGAVTGALTEPRDATAPGRWWRRTSLTRPNTGGAGRA